jgi:hypothetical protein
MSNRSAMIERKSDTKTWPTWAKFVVSFFLLIHMFAILATEAGEFPSSEIEREIMECFAPYICLINQQTAHRYYAPQPGATPIVLFRVKYRDKTRPDEIVRIPDPKVWPRIRFQRQLAMANNVLAERGMYNRAMMRGERPPEMLYPAFFARRVCWTHPGCESVEVVLRMHNFPPPLIAYEAARKSGTLNLDQEAFYGPPDKLGDFPCDELGTP